jgi:hypothetical protein
MQGRCQTLPAKNHGEQDKDKQYPKMLAPLLFMRSF